MVSVVKESEKKIKSLTEEIAKLKEFKEKYEKEISSKDAHVMGDSQDSFIMVNKKKEQI